MFAFGTVASRSMARIGEGGESQEGGEAGEGVAEAHGGWFRIE